MKTNLIDEQDKIELEIKTLKGIADYVGDKFDESPGAELNVVFIEKDTIRELNRKHRKIDSVTDVLSFSYVDSKNFKKEHGFEIVGEIYISPEIAKENASAIKEGWSITLELALLIIHGILHIYHYDHEIKEERTDMEAAQKSLLNDVRNNFSI